MYIIYGYIAPVYTCTHTNMCMYIIFGYVAPVYTYIYTNLCMYIIYGYMMDSRLTGYRYRDCESRTGPLDTIYIQMCVCIVYMVT